MSAAATRSVYRGRCASTRDAHAGRSTRVFATLTGRARRARSALTRDAHAGSSPRVCVVPTEAMVGTARGAAKVPGKFSVRRVHTRGAATFPSNKGSANYTWDERYAAPPGASTLLINGVSAKGMGATLKCANKKDALIRLFVEGIAPLTAKQRKMYHRETNSKKVSNGEIS